MSYLNQCADEQLVQMYANGNNEAFDTLLERYKNKLYSYILMRIHDDDKANDLFQETFVKAIICIREGKYTENGKFAAWITRIAHNLTIDHFRQVQNERWVSNDETDGLLFERLDLPAGNIEEEMVNQQTLDEVQALMDELPGVQREVVHMRLFQDLSFKEIADITGVSISTALGRMRYAIINMRKMAKKQNKSFAYY